MARTRILVVDEHSLLRHGIIAFINGQPDMIACGEADSLPSIHNKLAETKPHLIVIGLRLGTGDSLELVKAIKAQIPELLVLVYSAFEETIFAERALRAGAQGYVMKKAPKEELLAAFAILFRVGFMLAGTWPCVHQEIARDAARTSFIPRSKRCGKLIRPRDAHFPVAWLGPWQKTNRSFPESQCKNDREPSGKHQT